MPVPEINVGMADLKVARAPGIMLSLGLGSCVSIALYAAYYKTGGLAHIMLPDIEQVKNRSNRAKFANTAIADMVRQMEEMGVEKKFLKAKLAGGAQMFGFAKSEHIFNIGKRNVEKAREVLEQLRIKVAAEDTGGFHGRSVYFDLSTGQFRVKTIAHGEKLL